MKSVRGFTGVVSDLGGPTANMYRMACKDPEIERHCRRPSCRVPGDLRKPEYRSYVVDRAVPVRPVHCLA